MLCENIHSHAEIQSLQARSDELARADEQVLVNLVSLESVRMAAKSYALLRPMVDSTSLVCPKLALLSVVAGLALELHKLEHDLLPQVMDQEAKLERGVMEAFILMRNSAVTLLDLGKAIEEAQVLGGSLCESLSKLLKHTAVSGVEGKCDFAMFREHRFPWIVQLVTALLATPVHFSDSEE